MHSEALFLEWINKVWYKHTMKYHSALKRKEILTHDAAWMNLEDLYVVTIMLWLTNIFGLHAAPGSELLKPFWALRVIRYLLVVIISPFQSRLNFWMTLLISETKLLIKEWNFPPHPTCPGRRGTGNSWTNNGQWFNQPYLSMLLWSLSKKPIGWWSQSFLAGEYVQVLGGWLGRGLGIPSPPPTLLSASLPSGCSWVESFYNKLVI